MALSLEEKLRIVYFYALCVVLGLVVGVVGTGFQLFANTLTHMRIDMSWLFESIGLPGYLGMMSFSATAVMLSSWLIYRFAPEGAGSGVQEIEGALLGSRTIHWRRLLPTKFLAGSLALGANMVVGREGPTIQMGGNLGEMLGEKYGLDKKQRNILVGAGAAGGLATAFNAPLAGIVFVLEEMREHFNFTFLSFKAVAITCVISTLVLRMVVGQQADIPMTVYQAPDLSALSLFAILGVIIGFVGLGFNVCLMRTLEVVDKLRRGRRLRYALMMGLMVGALSWFLPGAVGGGYAILNQTLHLAHTTQFLLLLFVLRFILTMICYSSGVPGGVFAPMLALGTLLGVAFGQCCLMLSSDLTIYADMFAVAGMGALFAASIRAPITGIILIVEMTQNYSLILPSMMTCLVSTTIVQLADNPPLYTQLLKRTLGLRA